MVQDYKTINNKDGALSEGSSRLSDDDTDSGCNSSDRMFHNKFRTLLLAAVCDVSGGDWHVGEGSDDDCNLVVIVHQRY